MEFRQAFDPVRSLGGAWKLIARAPATMIVGAVLIFLIDGGGPGGMRFDDGRVSWFGALVVGAVALGGCCFGLLLWLFASLLHLGLAGALQRILTSGEERFSDLFQARGLFGSMVLARLLKLVLLVGAFLPFVVMIGGPIVMGHVLELEGIGYAIGSLFGLAYLPIFVYVVLGLLLVEEAVAFEGKKPIEGLQRSWTLAGGNRIQLLLYSLVTFGVTVAGLLCCFVGVLATGPWCRLAWFESYARFTIQAPADGMEIDR